MARNLLKNRTIEQETPTSSRRSLKFILFFASRPVLRRIFSQAPSRHEVGIATRSSSAPARWIVSAWTYLQARWSRRITEDRVYSLERQAAIGIETAEQSQFEILARHIFSRFFEGSMLSLEGDTATRVVQAAVMVAVPGLLWTMARIASYHQPVTKPLWPQASDHYFSILYSFVVMGGVSVFEWDLLFPDLLDCFVLTMLPIAGRVLFAARVTALTLLLGIFLFSSNVFCAIFQCLWFWTMTKKEPMYTPGYLGHLGSYLAAVLPAGIFAAASVVAVQGILMNLLGERLFRRISAALQSILITFFLIVFFLSLPLTGFLQAVLESGSRAVYWFPPFWFLGIEERLLYGPPVLPIFGELARIGCWATATAVVLAVATYPLAYWRKMRSTVEGAAAKKTRFRVTITPLHRVLDWTLLRVPARRAIYHFIRQTLLRSDRHRVYLAMYAGLGFSLILTCAVVLHVTHHHATLALSARGLRFAVPIVAFWTVAGLRAALMSPIDQRGSWIFRAISGQPSLDHLAGTRIWVQTRAALFCALAIAAVGALEASEIGDARAIAAQCIAGFGLALLLGDVLFANVMRTPFTEPKAASKGGLVFILVGYVGIFPQLIWNVTEDEPWLRASWGHLIAAIVVVITFHFVLCAFHQWRFREHCRWGEDDGESMQTLGLS